jgi:hypothetical protein
MYCLRLCHTSRRFPPHRSQPPDVAVHTVHSDRAPFYCFRTFVSQDSHTHVDSESSDGWHKPEDYQSGLSLDLNEDSHVLSLLLHPVSGSSRYLDEKSCRLVMRQIIELYSQCLCYLLDFSCSPNFKLV